MKWFYRKTHSVRLGRRRFGYERRDYVIMVPIVVAWPRIWPAQAEPTQELVL